MKTLKGRPPKKPQGTPGSSLKALRYRLNPHEIHGNTKKMCPELRAKGAGSFTEFHPEFHPQVSPAFFAENIMFL